MAERGSARGRRARQLRQRRLRAAHAAPGGLSFANAGVRSVTDATSAPCSYGVYAVGRLGATGTKSFRIDHPLHPENKYLLHYCTEGPEPLNVYGGSVTTDADGAAWVARRGLGRVEAVRNDAWVRTYGAPVELDKDMAERGKYQHPELHGQPVELGMDYRAAAQPILDGRGATITAPRSTDSNRTGGEK